MALDRHELYRVVFIISLRSRLVLPIIGNDLSDTERNWILDTPSAVSSGPNGSTLDREILSFL